MSNSSSEIFEQLIRINEHDVIIGISFPRYSMRTLKALSLQVTERQSDHFNGQRPFAYESVFIVQSDCKEVIWRRS